MFQQLLPLLPAEPSVSVIVATILGALAGVILWFAGSRYTRLIITLGTLAVGAVIGMILPRQMGWDINTMATAVAGAIIFGIAGFILYRACLGVGLAFVLALWTAIGIWLVYHETAPLTWPIGTVSIHDFFNAMWAGMPDPVKGPMPAAVAMAAVLGAILALLYPRIGTVMLHSFAGVTIVILMCLWAIQCRQIDWPAFLPTSSNAQIVLLAGMVCLGLVVQWQWLPAAHKPLPQRKSPHPNPRLERENAPENDEGEML